MPTKLQPLGNKVVVKRDTPKEQTASGIIIPKKALDKEVPRQGIVVAVGPEVGLKAWESFCRVRGGESKIEELVGTMTAPKRLSEGEIVLFNAFAGSDIEIGEGDSREKFTVMLEDDILAVLVTTPEQDPFDAAAASIGPKKGKK